jgi:hypothetical protein
MPWSRLGKRRWPAGCDDFNSERSELPQMLERDRNRDGMLDPDELEKDGPAKFRHTGPQSLRHSESAELGRLRLSLIFSAGDPAPTAQLGRVLINAQIAGPLSGQPETFAHPEPFRF